MAGKKRGNGIVNSYKKRKRTKGKKQHTAPAATHAAPTVTADDVWDEEDDHLYAMRNNYAHKHGKVLWGRRVNGKQSKRAPKGRTGAGHTQFRGCLSTHWVPGYYRCIKGRN